VAQQPTVAIVHDYLTQRGGAERVVLAMTRVFPEARLVTSVYDPNGTFAEFADKSVETSHLQHVGIFRRHHRLAFPLYPVAFGQMRVEADLVICSTSGWAHGVVATGRKVLYAYNPARWLYQSDDYLRNASTATRYLTAAVRGPLGSWDRRAAAGADDVIAISRTVQDRIRRSWGLDSSVVHPPISVDASGSQESVCGVAPGFLLVVARLLAYKNVDAVVETMRLLPGRQLVVVGDGPEKDRLVAAAPANVTFLSRVPEEQLRWLYANASALVAAAVEDFGLAPVEAMAFGTPVVALGRAGFLETVIEGENGCFFDEPEPREIADAVAEVDRRSWDRTSIAAYAADFSEDAFGARLRAAVGLEMVLR
jgi:glycosyltransferase involved in cell wall biosynthesis